MERIIVRRGRFFTYDLLRRTFGDNPGIEVMWDRRRPLDALAALSDVPVERRERVEWERQDYLYMSGKEPDGLAEPSSS